MSASIESPNKMYPNRPIEKYIRAQSIREILTAEAIAAGFPNSIPIACTVTTNTNIYNQVLGCHFNVFNKKVVFILLVKL
ncbi:hypothetical protein Hanom_Chr09g00802861 [Helianthus anomalus]